MGEVRVPIVVENPRTGVRSGEVIAVDGESTPCRVLFGEGDDATLLGLTVPEQLGLAVDPVQRRLVRTDFLLF